MKTRTRIEQSSLAKISKNSLEKIDVVFNKENIDKLKLSKLGKYFGSKSPRVIAESALCYVASAFIKPGLDMLDLSNYDKLGLIKTLKNRQEPSATKENNIIKISVPIWQITVIASNAEDTLPSAESLVIYSLYETLRRLTMLFGEEKEQIQ